MNRTTLMRLGVLLSMVYGVLAAVFHDHTFTTVGAVALGFMWVLFGYVLRPQPNKAAEPAPATESTQA